VQVRNLSSGKNSQGPTCCNPFGRLPHRRHISPHGVRPVEWIYKEEAVSQLGDNRKHIVRQQLHVRSDTYIIRLGSKTRGYTRCNLLAPLPSVCRFEEHKDNMDRYRDEELNQTPRDKDGTNGERL
jgi:hypothetical protein